VARLPAGVTILCARDATLSDWGITAAAVLPISQDPPLVAVALRADAGSTPHFVQAPRFTLSVLAAEHEELAERFASGRPDRFILGGFERARSGLAVVAGAAAVLECERREALARGDHVLLLGEAVGAQAAAGDRDPLVYVGGEYRRTSPT